MTQVVILFCLVVFTAAAGLAFRNFARRVQKYAAVAPLTPIARARGFTQITGMARAPDGAPASNPVTGTPCVWYRVVRETLGGPDYEDAEQRSRDPVLLDDGTGVCSVVIDRFGGSAEREVVADYNHGAAVILKIRAGTRLYAIGRIEPLARPERGATHRLVRDPELGIGFSHHPLERTTTHVPLLRRLSVAGFALSGVFLLALIGSAYAEWG